MTKFKFVRTVLPALVGFLLLRNTCFGAIDNGDESKVAKVRKWIWPLLLISIGLAWEFSAQSSSTTIDLGFLVLIGSVYWWYWLWCTNGVLEQTKPALFLVAIIAATLVWTTAKSAPKASLLLLPLLAWIMLIEHLPRIPHVVKIPFFTIEMPYFQDGSISFDGRVR